MTYGHGHADWHQAVDFLTSYLHWMQNLYKENGMVAIILNPFKIYTMINWELSEK